MTIRDGLALDHAYVAIATEDFESLSTILLPRSGIVRQLVKSGDDSWEGIYARCRTGSYFEFFKGARDGGLGIATSASRAYTMDARKITEEFPDLPWQKGTRYGPKKEPWFDWASPGDYEHHETTLFNIWIMHYHQMHTVPTEPRPAPSIDALAEINVVAGLEMRQEIEGKSIWLPGTKVSPGADQIVLVIPDKAANPVNINITFAEDRKGFTLSSLVWWTPRGVKWEPRVEGPWRLDVAGELVSLGYIGD